jgi:anaerobic magnesium-protoporphyrin IX monomethyl ester cyclase
MNRLPLVRAPDTGEFEFVLDPRISEPSSFRAVFVILLDGDLVMSPEHVGVAMMASVLRRAGFSASIVEVPHGEEAAVVDRLFAEAPSIVCFTLMSLNVASCVAFSALLRARMPALRIICGGPAGTYADIEVLEHNPHVDVVAIGEGEPTIFELVQRTYLGESITDCLGICYRAEDGSFRRNPTRPLLHDLDALPFAARDQLEAHGGRLEYVRVSTSRGCVARCTFCSAPHIGNRVQAGKAWRGRSVESILDELTAVVRDHRFRTFDFVDSTFEDPDGGPIGKQRIARLARGILDRQLDIYFNCCMRAENWSDDDHDLLELMVSAGLEKVNVGIESGTEGELRLWDKRATVDDNVRIIRLLREHDVYLAMGFIQFHPYATIDTITANARFLREHAGHNLRRMTERLEIYPGTPLVATLQADGLLNDDFHRTLGHYEYRFRDERVARLARHFASLYNDADYHERGAIAAQSSVFRFETFNVVFATYLSRTRRRFRDVPGAGEVIAELRDDVHAIKQAIGAFNYGFFMDNVSDALADRDDPQKRRRQIADLDGYFKDRMKDIGDRQLRAGRALTRLGCDLSRVLSKLVASPGSLRTYTGGGTPCW